MQKIDDITVSTAKSTEEIYYNITENVKNNRVQLIDSYIWREQAPIAIVGGGPSLKDNLELLSTYKHVMACGSVHDYLVDNSIDVRYCVVCDPDEIMGNYLQKGRNQTIYLIASQCHPSIFKLLKNYTSYIWHADGYKFDKSPYEDGAIGIGGGCTVGTRALCIALGMGFTNLHLFGFDTCLDKNFKHHAYDYSDETKESIGNITEVSLGGPEGKKFYVAGYMLAQLFDFKKLLAMYADRLQITIHGGGLLSELMDLAKKKALEEGLLK